MPCLRDTEEQGQSQGTDTTSRIQSLGMPGSNSWKALRANPYFFELPLILSELPSQLQTLLIQHCLWISIHGVRTSAGRCSLTNLCSRKKQPGHEPNPCWERPNLLSRLLQDLSTPRSPWISWKGVLAPKCPSGRAGSESRE